jgi:exodeoxyribonuclease V alpha subunit
VTGGGEAIMHGGVKFYRGSAAAARSYVEVDHSRADDYYLAEGSGLAEHHVAMVGGDDTVRVERRPDLDGDGYERWVAGYDVATGRAKGRLRDDERALRFVEVVVNGPKTWSLAAALHPEIAEAYDAAQSRAAGEIIGWVAEHATTRVGPRGRQVQVPVEEIEAAVVRHYTSRAGDPHRHLHLQINSRVFAAGAWRGLHSVGVRDSVEAINGIGHSAIMCDPEFRAGLAARGYRLDETGEIRELAPFAGRFSERATQIARNVDRYEAEWRAAHPGQEPGPKLRRSWDRRAWADARPDKVVPASGADLVARWNEELHDLGFHQPHQAVGVRSTPIGAIDRDVAVEVILSRLGVKRSAWNAADVRGETEQLIASVGIVAEHAARTELAEDITSRAVAACRPLLERDDVPEHIRALTSTQVLAVEAALTQRLAIRAEQPVTPARRVRIPARLVDRLDPGQRRAVAALAGHAGLLVIEGAAGTGKTTTLAAARAALDAQERRLVVVTPTLKAAETARQQVGADAFSAAWLAHQQGYRWDEDGHWTHTPSPREQIAPEARLLPGDVLLVDEAGMLDQDTAHALIAIADHAGAGVVFLGDRHQLPAVGRGGVLDLATRWAPDQARLELAAVHRFTDPAYADLSLLMRTGERSGEVFDQLVERGQIVLHSTEVERTAALAAVEGLVIADAREHVTALNAVIRDHHHRHAESSDPNGEPSGERSGEQSGEPVTRAGERIGLGDRVATRRNDRDLGVANRDTWTVAGIGDDGSLLVTGRVGERHLPADYVRDHVELAYATTVHGAQGNTVDYAHFALGDTTGAAAAYVAMTRGRHTNTAHLVAEDLDTARRHWVEVFSRDRADLGPARAAEIAAEDIERYGPRAPARAPGRSIALQAGALQQPPRRRPRPAEPPPVGAPARGPGPGIGF